MEKLTFLYHKLKSIVGYSVATVVIVVAIAVSGFRLVLTTADSYQNEVEQLASSLLKQPVRIGRMDAKLSNFVPTLVFDGVQIVSKNTKKNLFTLSRVEVGLSLSDLVWHQDIVPEKIIVRGMDLHITRTVEGLIKIKGVDINGLDNVDKNESTKALEQWLLHEGKVAVEDSTFMWVDEQNSGLTWFFEDINFLLAKNSERYQFLLLSELPNVLGKKVEVSIDLLGDINSPETWDVKAFIEIKNINLNALKKYIKNTAINLSGGMADVKLWADWENKKIKKLSGDISLRNVSYNINNKDQVNLRLVSGIFDSEKIENNIWNVSVDKFNYLSNKTALKESKFSLAFDYKDKNVETFYIKANEFKLDAVSKIITDNHLTEKNIEESIRHLNLRGDIRNLYIAWQNNELNNLNADFSEFSTNARGNIPKVESLSGHIAYEEQEGVISLLSKDTTIGFPKLFRDNFVFDTISADIPFSNTKKGMLFNAQHLEAKNTDVKAHSTATFWLPKDGSSPHLNFQIHASEGDASKVSKYLPVGIMGDSLVEWLDEGILSGKANKGTIIFNGKLKDFPFDNNQGVFSADIEASNVFINYWNGWPNIENATVIGKITGQGLNVHLKEGRIKNNTIYDSFAKIDSFSKAELLIDIKAKGATTDAMQYVINSPVLPNAKDIINSSRLSGKVDVNLKLNIPLDEEIRKKNLLSYSGRASLSDASLYMLEDKLDIEKVSGDILFSEKKLSSDKLLANIFDEKVSVSISSTKKNIKVSAKGKINPGTIMARFNIPGADHVSGRSKFYGDISFPIKKSKYTYPTLTINSQLIGVKSTLPEMLYKKVGNKQNTQFKTAFVGKNKTRFSVNFKKKGSAILELKTSKDHTYLSKGAISFSKNKAVLPKKNILFIDGSINKLTPARWNKIIDKKENKRSQNFIVNPIILNLDKLKLLTTNKTQKNELSNTLMPRDIPPIQGVIKNLYFDKMFLGRLDLKVSKRKNVLHFDEVAMLTKSMNLFAHGDWSFIKGKHKTNMDITLKSDNFGNMLGDLGHKDLVDKGNVNTTAKLYWDGSPTEFSLNKLNGDAKLNLENGNIRNIDAGAGRLLGFVSLSALPRKFFGDFKDTFKSGFSFDSAKGKINLYKGHAFTNNFLVNSSVSKIMINGRTGLVTRDYDNVIKVIPDVGGGIAGVAALLVNLPAGIGLWLFDKITGEQFDEVSTRVYNVTGSWDKPKIDLIEN